MVDKRLVGSTPPERSRNIWLDLMLYWPVGADHPAQERRTEMTDNIDEEHRFTPAEWERATGRMEAIAVNHSVNKTDNLDLRDENPDGISEDSNLLPRGRATCD